MQPMWKRALLTFGTGAGLLILGLVTAYAQQAGRTWIFHSNPKGACPGVDWHVTRVGNDLHGVIGWDRMQHMATLEGAIGSNGDFTVNLKEVAGGDRTGTITGQVRRDGWLFVRLQDTGTACDGQNVTIPIWRPKGS